MPLITFVDSSLPPLQVAEDAALAEVLDGPESPILFGCRTGVCGTCLSSVEGEVTPPDPDEQEILELHAPETPDARLCCQLRAQSDLRLRYLGT